MNTDAARWVAVAHFDSNEAEGACRLAADLQAKFEGLFAVSWEREGDTFVVFDVREDERSDDTEGHQRIRDFCAGWSQAWRTR